MCKLCAAILAVLLSVNPVLAATCTLLTSGSSSANATSRTTASISPGSNRLLLLATSNIRNAANACTDADVSAVTGNGLTWVLVQEQCYGEASTPTNNLALFRAMGASPSSGAITIEHGGTTQLNASWSVVECTDVDTSGTNGSGAIVQSNKTTGNGTTLSVSLSAFSQSTNPSFAAFSVDDNVAVTEKSGWTELSENQVSDGGTDHTLQVQVLHSADAAPSATIGGALDWAGIAVEIKSSVVADTGGDIVWFP